MWKALLGDIVPKRPGDFELTDEQKRAMAELETASYAAQAKRIEILRNAARDARVAAEKLEDLKSDNGKLFVETEKNYAGYREAISQPEGTTGYYYAEHAYFCALCGLDKYVWCGWVKGEPSARNFNEIGFLCGSAGTRYYCRICGNEIGEVVTMCS